MRYLLDTHILFWAMSNESKLSQSVLAVLNDSFDRILIAQAKTESMIFLTHDGLLSGYEEDHILIV